MTATRFFCSLAAIMLLSAVGARSVGCQQLRVNVLLPDGVSPAAGVVVEATKAAVAAVAARAVTGRDGSAMLRLPGPGAYRVRALRVGFQPTELGGAVVSLDSIAVIAGQLGVITVSLDAIRVDAQSRCEVAGIGAADVGLALAQARIALAASSLSAPDGRATAFWTAYRFYTDRQFVPLSSVRVSTFESSSEVPFRSIGTDALLTDGFVTGEVDDLVFSAPDAGVLLSEQFVEAHCFRISPSHPTESSWLGVTFEPALGVANGTTRIRGTLWIERSTNELRRVDFGFVGTERWLGSAHAEGWLDFRRLAGGTWFVERWGIRIPRPSIVDGEPPRTVAQERPRRIVNITEFVGAAVDSIVRDGVRMHASDTRPEAVFPEVAESSGKRPICETGSALPPLQQGILFGEVVDSLGRIVRGREVRATWLSPTGSRFARASPREIREFAAPEGFFLACGLPIGGTIQLSLVGDKREAVKVVLPSSRPYDSATLVVSLPE